MSYKIGDKVAFVWMDQENSGEVISLFGQITRVRRLDGQEFTVDSFQMKGHVNYLLHPGLGTKLFKQAYSDLPGTVDLITRSLSTINDLVVLMPKGKTKDVHLQTRDVLQHTLGVILSHYTPPKEVEICKSP